MARKSRPTSSAIGFSAIELLFAVAVTVTVGGIAIPPLVAAVDDFRAAGAARYVAIRFQRARMEAVLRSAATSVRFTSTSGGFAFATYVDGNGNGVLSSDIQSGIDVRITPLEKLSDNFAGVQFATLPGLPPVDPGGTPPGSDPIRLGSGNAATFTAAGTASTGSVYIRGARNQQYVVRVYGDTGKTRLLIFDARSQKWKPL